MWLQKDSSTVKTNLSLPGCTIFRTGSVMWSRGDHHGSDPGPGMSPVNVTHSEVKSTYAHMKSQLVSHTLLLRLLLFLPLLLLSAAATRLDANSAPPPRRVSVFIYQEGSASPQLHIKIKRLKRAPDLCLRWR